MVATAAQNRFVPEPLNCADFAALEPLYHGLRDRLIDTVESLMIWLEDFSALTAVVEEYGARRYIDKSCHTDDAAIEAAYLHFIEQIEPKIKPLYFQLQKKFLAAPARKLLKEQRFEILAKKWSADVEIFREENVALETAVTKLNNEYDKLCGARIIHFRGSDYTPQQMARFSEETDRTTRQEAWEANTNRRLKDWEAIETIFDQLLALRKEIAKNAGLPDYRAYTWKQYKRFDYLPEQCLAFADSIAGTCVPLASKMATERAGELGLATLRPWDLDVDPKGRAPLRPFQEDQVDLFVSKTREVFDRLSPALAKEFDELSAHHNLDLDSRKGKQPGGYQMSLEQSRQPFIFMNAAGLQRDVETLLHEGGACVSLPRRVPARAVGLSAQRADGILRSGQYVDGIARQRAFRHLLQRPRRRRPRPAEIDRRNHRHSALDRDHRLVSALALHASGSCGERANGGMAAPPQSFLSGRGLERPRVRPRVKLAASTASLSLPVLLCRVWHRATGGAATMAQGAT